MTVTRPKSRSIATSEAIRTAKPAIAVTPEARTAAPVERRCARARRRRRARRRAPRGSGRDSRTENSVEIAITSALSAADIGFSGTPSSQSTSADQPVASAIGTSGTHARAHER